MNGKPIIQRRAYDCGIAALSMALGCSYMTIRNLIDERFARMRRDVKDGITFYDARYAAKEIGVQLCIGFIDGRNRESERRALRGRACVLVVKCLDDGDYHKTGDHHAVYFDGYKVHDPSQGRKYPKNGNLAFERCIAYWIEQSEIDK